MKLILRFIALKMSILRVDAAIIKRKKVKRNLYPFKVGLSSFLCKFLEKILWGGEPPRLQNWSL